MSKSAEKQFEAFNALLGDLIGHTEEWTAQELDEFLTDAGVDMQATSRKLYERVGEIAGSYHAKNQNVPLPVANLLRQMRPIDVPLRDPKEAIGVARKWIASLRQARPQVASLHVAHAFRNRRDQLTSSDLEVLDRLERKLLNGRRSEGDGQ